MIEYIYFVKCPNCEDEPFDFFDKAKEFALGCLSKKPIITQIEVDRNDFGECVGSSDLGTVWSWEELMSDVPMDNELTTFSKGKTLNFDYDPDYDPEFTALDNSTLDYAPDNFRKLNGLKETYYAVIEVDGKERRFPFDDRQAAREYLNYVRAGKDPSFKGKKIGSTYTESSRRPSGAEYEPLSEQLKTWICWYEGDDIGTVAASTKEEAEEAMMNQFPEYQYDNTDWGVEEAVSEVCHKKPIPEGMTVEKLVEEMEENEDVVECKWCNELFDKSEVRYEIDLGYLCPQCEAAIKSRGETLTFKEGPYDDNSLNETFDPKETVELFYDSLTATITGPKRDVDDWDEVEYSDSYTFTLDKTDVATTIWENFITEEDVVDIPGGLEALEDDSAWNTFLETHFDILFEKYYKELLNYYREDAIEAFSESASYDDYITNQEADRADMEYDAWRDERDFTEDLKTAETDLDILEEVDTYKEHLTLCPECGTDSFDLNTGLCINCGFNNL
jgi:Zn finger protein HypA/HybF involved in hydrogenase expression